MIEKYGTLPEDNRFVASSVNELSRDQLIGAMKKYTFLSIRGLNKPGEVGKAMAKLHDQFERSNDRPSSGERPDEVRSNFQKLAFGGASRRYNNFPRFFRTIYNPMWESDDFGLRSIFVKAIEVRNLLYGLPTDFAKTEIEENGLWSATRVHQYPKGGGFFQGHRDTTLLDVAREKETNFYQVVIVLTKKGKDFSQGGAFVDLENQRYMIEDECEVGDIIVYDGRTVHGVEDIDPTESLDLDSINGRVAGFVSLYKVMN